MKYLKNFTKNEITVCFNNIPEEEPDEWDLEMLAEIESDPDCREFVSEEEVKKIL